MSEYAARQGGPENPYTRRNDIPPIRIPFHPIIDLDTGSVVAVSVLGPAGRVADLGTGLESWQEPGLESDVDRAILAAQATTRHDNLMPLHVSLHARTLADDRSMDGLRQTLMSLGAARDER